MLLTSDGSEFAAAAMGRAVDLLGREHRFAALTVVNPKYVPAAPMAPMEALPSALPDPELEREIGERDERLQAAELRELLARLGIETEPRIEVGEPGVEICAVAGSIDADVVVVGSHGHGHMREMLLGSVSHYVIHHAPCPVLAIRPDV